MVGKKRGISLIELVVAVFILGLLASLGILAMRPATHQASSRGLANTVAEALNEARVRAISTGSPVVIGFPSNNGANPLTNCLYRLEGSTAPAVANTQNFSGDFPNTYILNGMWPTDSAAFRNPASVPQANPTPVGSPWIAYQNPLTWLPAAYAADYCYVFRPDGTVVSNGMVAYDGAYHILVTAGVGSWTGPSSIGGSLQLMTPTLLGETFTIELTLNGDVHTETGVSAMSAGAISFVDSPNTSQPAFASAPPQSGGTNPVPTVISLTTLSNEAGSGAPPPPAVSVGVDGYITLDAVAADTAATGQRLYAAWTVTPASTNLGTGPSGYSVPVTPGAVGESMTWDSAANSGAGAWHSIWDWRPPANAVPGDQFTLTLVVQNSLATSLSAAVSRYVTITPPGKILCTRQRSGGLGVGLGKMNVDGTFPVSPAIADGLPLPAGWLLPTSAWSDDYFTASTDGGRLAFRTLNRSNAFFGTALTEPTYQTANEPPFPAGCAQLLQSISPAGDLVAYLEYNNIAAPPPMTAGHLYVQEVGAPYRRVLIDGDTGFCGWPGQPYWRDAFPGMLLRMCTDRIAWDAGSASNEWDIYYTDFGSAATDTPGVTVPTPRIKTCTVVADAAAGPHLKAGSTPTPVTSPDLTGCYSPNIPYYETAPSAMTFLRWNGSPATTKTVSVWDMSVPGAPVVHDQNLPPDFYQNPIYVPKSLTAGQDSIVCGVASGYVYSGGYGAVSTASGIGNVNLFRFTPNPTGAFIIDLQQISDPAIQGNASQPAYTPIPW